MLRLAVEDWIYDFGALDEYAVTAFWTDRYAECVDACDRLLSEGKLPTEERGRVLKNKESAVRKQQEIAALSSPEAGFFLKLLREARQKEELALPNDEVIAAYMEATSACPTRAEALHGAARFCRNRKVYERGCEFAAHGLAVAYPKDAMGVRAGSTSTGCSTSWRSTPTGLANTRNAWTPVIGFSAKASCRRRSANGF